MAGITQTIPSFKDGISEQPDHLKYPGQVTDLVNAIPDITYGLLKRPGSKRVKTTPLTNVQAGGSWFHYFRGQGEGSYIGQVDKTGILRVWNCLTGAEMTTAYAISKTITIDNGGSGYTSAPTVTFTNPQQALAENKATATATINSSGVVTAVTVTSTGLGYTAVPTISFSGGGGSNAAATCTLDNIHVRNYLQTATPENLQFLTVNDSTFVNNRDSSNYTTQEISDGGCPALNADGNTLQAGNPRTITKIGKTGLTDNAPHRNYAFVELLRSANGRQYGLNVNNGATETTIKRATRIKIVEDGLYEGNHTGHCPSIGTQVFNVSSINTFDNGLVETTTNNANYNKWTFDFRASPTTGSNYITPAANGSHVRLNYNWAHGYALGQALVYDKGLNTDAAPGLIHGHVYFVSNVGWGLANGVFLNTDKETAEAGTHNINISYTAATRTAKDWFIPVEHYQYVKAYQNISGTKIKTVEGDTSKTNLIFRLNILGQQGVAPGSSGSDPVYRCSYQREVVLLHGGEGWQTGDQAIVATTTAADKPAGFVVEVVDHEETKVNATISTNGDGLVRPAPTPFDADTAVTADTILGGITDALPSGVKSKVIGTGIYLYTDDASDPANDQKFSVEVVEDDLMRVMHSSVNDVTNLPNQCKHGYIVQISNSRMADEDDYYLVFNGNNGRDGSGSWSECAKGGIDKSLTNMPLIIQRTSLTGFTLKQFEYEDRRVGNDKTNQFPSFTDKVVNKIIFFRNRLAFLSGENVVLCRPGTVGRPDFFTESALTVSASDPIDISAASMFPSELFDGIETTSGLLVLSTNQQFLLSADDTVLNPDTAKLRSLSTFNYNIDVPPVSLGTTVAYIDNSGKYSRLNEMANIRREGEPSVVEVSKVVPTLLPKDLNLLTNSRENGLVLFGQDTSNYVIGFKYFQVAEKREQSSWFRWKFNKKLKYHFIIDDEYFFLDEDNFLQKMRLIQFSDDPSVTDENAINYLLHLDNYTTINGGQFNGSNNTTAFNNVAWLNSVGNTSSNPIIYDLAVLDSQGRYGKPTISGTTLTLVGDWRDSTLPSGQTHFTVGYIYDYEVKLPTLYPIRSSGNQAVADVNSSLVLHRLKFHFGKVGSYTTSLKRVGKPQFDQVHESVLISEYEAGNAPYLPENIKTVPVYERNTNVDIILKSTHPSPATLHALSWEGDYSPKFYRRA